MERCPRCRMVQYLTALNRCRRCYLSLVVPVVAPPEPRVPTRPDVAAGVRGWRRIRGLTQKQLAVGARLPRTYVSRIENGRIIPGLVTLERVADALKVALPALLASAPPNGRSSGNGNAESLARGETAMGTVLALRHLPQTAVLLHPRRWMRRTVSRKSCNPAAC